MSTPTAGLRERKKHATRTALSEAALRLSVRRGVAGVTIDQIAEEADVSTRTFFNYFSSKEEAIVAADTAAAGERLCRTLAARPTAEPIVVALRATLLELLTGEAQDREWLAELRLVRSAPALLPHHIAAHVQTERDLAEVIAERTGLDPETDLYPALVASCTVAAMRIAARRWLDGPTGPSLTELAGLAFDQLCVGLGNPLGTEPGNPLGAEPGNPLGAEPGKGSRVSRAP